MFFLTEAGWSKNIVFVFGTGVKYIIFKSALK